MSRAIDGLAQLLVHETIVYRKGAEITEREVGGVKVIEVFGYPETPSRGELVDVHFVNVGFTERAADPAGFRSVVEAACAEVGYNGVTITATDLAEGPSYITLGGWLGSQELALRFLALAYHYGCTSVVVTPEVMGATGAQADELAGAGYVMLGGWKPE
jgi:hypothetical protein